jgi:hypothetical protein
MRPNRRLLTAGYDHRIGVNRPQRWVVAKPRNDQKFTGIVMSIEPKPVEGTRVGRLKVTDRLRGLMDWVFIEPTQGIVLAQVRHE